MSAFQPQYLLGEKWSDALYVRTSYQLYLAGCGIDEDKTSEMRRAMSVHGLKIKFLTLLCHFEMVYDFGSYFECVLRSRRAIFPPILATKNLGTHVLCIFV